MLPSLSVYLLELLECNICIGVRVANLAISISLFSFCDLKAHILSSVSICRESRYLEFGVRALDFLCPDTALAGPSR